MNRTTNLLSTAIRTHPDISIVCLIVFFFLFSLVVVSPFFEFPIDDGFAFAWSVYQFFEKGTIIFSDWVACSFVFLYAWGIIFCLPFGFSFAALTISVLFLSCATTIVFYYACRKILRVPPMTSMIATFSLLLNPLYYQLSNAFLTDVVYTGLLLSGIFLCWSSNSRNANFRLFGGSTLLGLSFLTRQIGIFGLVGVLAVFILQKERRISHYLIAIGPPVAMIIAYFFWTNLHGHTTVMQGQFVYSASFKQLVDLNFLTRILPNRTFNMIMDLGLFLSPIVVPFLFQKKFWIQFFRKNQILICIVWGTLIIGGTVYRIGFDGDVMPFMPNIFMRGWVRLVWLRVMCTAITVPAAILVFSLLTRYVIELVKNISSSVLQIAIIIVIVLHFVTTLIYLWHYDTYLLPLIALMLFLLVDLCSNKLQLRPNITIAGIIFIIMFIWTASMTVGDHARIKTMWQSAEKLLNDGVPLKEIDGDFEWNHWHHFQEAAQDFKRQLGLGNTSATLDMFKGHLPLYKINFLPADPHYQTEETVPYSIPWLPIHKYIYIQKRIF
jgi:hypothetical protein